MALPELLAALRRDGEAEAAALIANARAEAEALVAAARQTAERWREAALADERNRLALDTESAVAMAASRARAEELAARARVLARSRVACRSAAEAAERSLPLPALVALLAAGRRYLPPRRATLHCPEDLLATARAAGGEEAVEVAAAGQGLALISGDWTVELGLPSLIDGRWPELAARILRDLESS